VKTAVFGYHAARSVEEAVELLAAYEGTARLLAGGQSLVPMMNMRLIRPDALIDVNGLSDLDGIEFADDTTVIGALTRYTTLEHSSIIADRLPLVARMVRHIGDRQVRNRGTIGGSLVQGDPTGEMPLACTTLGASVRVVGPGGRREIPVEELYEGSYATVLDPLEMVTHVVFRRRPALSAFAECCRRHNDFAVVAVAAVAERVGGGRVGQVRVGLAGVNDTTVLSPRSGEVLSGSVLGDGEIEEAAAAATYVIDPPSDVRASAEYRRHLVPIYVRRVLRDLRLDAGLSPEGSP
jgi:carbon-monoxide dehydrogenase medium subunit